MFYETLEKRAAERANKEEAVDKAITRVALGLGGAGALAVGSSNLYDGLKQMRPDEVERVKSLSDKIRPDVALVLRDNNRHLFNPGGHSKMNKWLDSMLAGGAAFQPFPDDLEKKLNTRGLIVAPKDSNTTSLLHEIGHATGGEYRHGAANVKNVLVGLSQKAGKPGTYLGAGRLAYDTYAVARAKTKEDLDKIERRNRNMTIAHGLVQAPLLAEEARANLRAVGLGKKFNARANKAQLGAAFGTYLAHAAGKSAVPYFLTRHAIKKRRKELED